MSALITSALLTRCGSITNPTLGGYVDAAGNVVGSPGFLPNYVIDYAGNLGTIPNVNVDCTFIATIIGSAIPPGEWEMQLGTAETVGANGGTIGTSYVAGTTAATALHSFVSLNATGYLTGAVSGTGTWTIKSGPEAINGTGYIGAGLLVATGANTHTGPTVMQTGTKLQLGADCTNNVTKIGSNLTLAEGAVVTQYNGWNVNTFLTSALDNNGTYNVTGCGACGVGGVGRATTVNNNGVINLDKTSWGFSSTWAGTGFVNVKSGATFQLAGNSVNNVTRVNLNGNGWRDAGCVEQGALHATVSGVSQNMRINVQSASTIKTANNVGVTYTGVLTGSAPLTVTTLSATKPNGNTAFTNTANTYNGTITVDGTVLVQDNTTSLQYAKIVLTNGSRIQSSNASQTIGSLASSDPTTSWQIGGSNNVFIKNNGITQFDGSLSMIGSIANVWLEGGATNQLTLTKTGQTATVYARNGSKVILQGATFLLGSSGSSGQMRISAGSTISAGTSTTAACTYLYIDAASALDVRAAGAGTGLLKVTTGFSMGAGWKVNALDPLPPGTYPIIQKPNTTLLTPGPTLGINNTGGTVTFTQVGNLINMVVTA
jgi:hypothetical protein